MTRWQCLLILAGWVLFPAVDLAQAEEAGRPLASFQVGAAGDPLLLPVAVWGQERLFMLDTGCTYTCFDLPARNALGREIKKELVLSPHGSFPVGVYSAPEMRIGNLSLKQPTSAMVIDLAPIRRVTGTDEQGILGIQSIRRYIIQIDFDRRLVSFLAAGSSDPGWGTPFPLTLDDMGLPRLKLSICGEECTCLVDTGATNTSVDHELCEDLRRAGKLRPLSRKKHITFKRSRDTTAYIADRITLGRFEHANLHVADSKLNIIGLDYLSRYRVTLDLPRGVLYLSPSAHHLDADRTDMSGLHILKEDGQIRIHSVDDDSPAKTAGVEPGDQLVRVDGRDASSYSMFDLRRLFKSTEGRRVVLTLMRSGKPLEIAFTLRMPTPPPGS